MTTGPVTVPILLAVGIGVMGSVRQKRLAKATLQQAVTANAGAAAHSAIGVPVAMSPNVHPCTSRPSKCVWYARVDGVSQHIRFSFSHCCHCYRCCPTGQALEGFGVVTLASLLPVLAVEVMGVVLSFMYTR